MINGYSVYCLLEALGLGILVVMLAAIIYGVLIGIGEVIPTVPSPDFSPKTRKILSRTGTTLAVTAAGVLAIYVLVNIGLGILRSIGTSCKI